jgi:hypothetical protein
MKREVFLERKNDLVDLVNSILAKNDIGEQDKISLNTLLDLLNLYSYENRLGQKGLLIHTIIDSLELDYSLGKQFINFDNDIS